ncbi:MAG: twin-arginine translocase TatA/TatE family subunit [Thaumarchaeota archaeon]|nr:twin-arginine translocase TatA/TatE family subunit [Nitrososphaerota archaeon]MDD9826166.1 twin-arginine translocase TatA/TatE family subunit [Nitrososphaerota archaeon]
MEGVALSIGGSEWVIIAFVAIVMLLGADRLPGAARRLGRLAGEYGRARDEIRGHAAGMRNMRPAGPVATESEKLDEMARTLGLSRDGRTDEEMRRLIADSVGGDARRRDGQGR